MNPIFFIFIFSHLAAQPVQVGTSVVASQPATAPLVPLTAAQRHELAWLPDAARAQRQVLDSLVQETGHPVTLPKYPADPVAASRWFFNRRPTSTDPKTLYPLIAGNLMVAQRLLRDPDLGRRRVGLVIARYSNVQARQQLKDLALSPRIVEAFLLPNLSVAYPESWKDVSQREILEDANDAYRDARETTQQIAILRYMVHYDRGQNAIDWARVQLAQAWAAQGRYDQAIALADAIKDPSMSGGKKLADGWKKKRDAQTPPPRGGRP